MFIGKRVSVEAKPITIECHGRMHFERTHAIKLSECAPLHLNPIEKLIKSSGDYFRKYQIILRSLLNIR